MRSSIIHFSRSRSERRVAGRLEISNFMSRVTGSSVALQPEVIGSFGKEGYGGFQITDGTTYAPQMLWEMSHYCEVPPPNPSTTASPVRRSA